MNSAWDYKFSWELVGDTTRARPNLGPSTRLEVYRLMQFTFRDVLAQHVGKNKTDEIFYGAGKLAGREFYRHIVGDCSSLEEFIRRLQEVFKEMGIGILRVEEADPEAERYVLTMAEDLDCSGLPELNTEICVYDEGFIAGLLEGFSRKRFKVKEVDCWCTGERTCRFLATAEGQECE